MLVVTAVDAEAEAFLAGLSPAAAAHFHVAAVGVGPTAAAAGTARLLARAEADGAPHPAVLSVGIAGGFAGTPIGATVLGARSIAADLGAEDPSPGNPSGFLSIDELGFGSNVLTADPALLTYLRTALPYAVVGDVLTLGTVTGTAATAARLADRHPAAVAETMEGYGAASAAAGAAVRFAELRTISNPVGPRDRSAWRIRDALQALTAAARALSGAQRPWEPVTPPRTTSPAPAE
ncbi:MAG TPA: futalosine hydrolase [Actinoplanes sp.]|nr:futalosine hydrolase [Actinoplanes sp.]